MQRGWRRRPSRANARNCWRLPLYASATVSSFLVLGLEPYASALQSYQDNAT